MEIIEPPSPYSLDFTCIGCSAKLRGTEEDLVGAMDEGNAIYYFLCPCCERRHTVAAEEVPAHLQLRILKLIRRAQHRAL